MKGLNLLLIGIVLANVITIWGGDPTTAGLGILLIAVWYGVKLVNNKKHYGNDYKTKR